MAQVLTFADVAKHASREDLYIVLNDKVYNISPFIEEHPGGEEILLELGGQDATRSFNEAGHTNSAYEILTELFVGELKRMPGDPTPPVNNTKASRLKPSEAPRMLGDGASHSGTRFYLIVLLLVGMVMSAGYRYTQSKEQN